jgi:hypothetical protein
LNIEVDYDCCWNCRAYCDDEEWCLQKDIPIEYEEAFVGCEYFQPDERRVIQ